MCGIAGIIDVRQDLSANPEIIENMTARLANRGPDAEGYYLYPHAVLGHRRLVVVDPEGGSQPMTRTIGKRSCTIVYNGELYNTLSLRSELEARGYNFLTRNSDTEALLFAYMEWGKNCVQRFNGIYAFAIWDEQQQGLFMARDRLGVKPLFYTLSDKCFIFASELKAILAHPQVKPVLDEEGLAEIFVMGPSRTPGNGIFKSVKELRPGYYLHYSGQTIETLPYWKLSSHIHEDDIDTTKSKIRGLLSDAVLRQLVADVPLATFLSGGLDSTAISALASAGLKNEGRGQLRTFSVDYAENDKYFKTSSFQLDADHMWVGKVSEALGTEHKNIVLNSDDLADALIPALFANDYPGMADIDSSLYLFCREVKKEVTVVLSGECADEIFGGYPWFHHEKVINATSFPWIRGVGEKIAVLSPELINKIKPEQYLADRYREAISEVPLLPGESSEEASIRELFYLNITRFMPTLLDRKDRMSMACGLEVRVPFADHKLLEYVWNVPWKIKNYGYQSKGILRGALTDVLPDDVLQRPKSPYPKTHNPQYMSIVRAKALQILEDSQSLLHCFLDTMSLRTRIMSGRQVFSKPWFGQLMGDAQYLAWLIQLDKWLKDYRVVIV